MYNHSGKHIFNSSSSRIEDIIKCLQWTHTSLYWRSANTETQHWISISLGKSYPLSCCKTTQIHCSVTLPLLIALLRMIIRNDPQKGLWTETRERPPFLSECQDPAQNPPALPQAASKHSWKVVMGRRGWDGAQQRFEAQFQLTGIGAVGTIPTVPGTKGPRGAVSLSAQRKYRGRNLSPCRLYTFQMFYRKFSMAKKHHQGFRA